MKLVQMKKLGFGTTQVPKKNRRVYEEPKTFGHNPMRSQL